MEKIRTISDLIAAAKEQRPDKTAVYDTNSSICYKDIYDQSIKLSNFLVDNGINKGNRICIFFEKRIEKVSSIFGTSVSGCVFVPIRRLSTTHQAVHIIQDCQAEVLITTSAKIQQLSEHIRQMPSLKIIILLENSDHDTRLENISIYNWNDIISSPLIPQRRIHISELDIAAILYTSGSTGNPKGVVLSHLNIIAGAKKVTEYLKISESDKILGILSFGFDYGLNQMMSSFLNCAQIILMNYLFPKDILNAVKKYKITGLAAVATTWIKLLQMQWDSFSTNTLRYITNSGGAIPRDYVIELKKRLPRTDLFLMYGLTEAFRSTYLDPSLVESHPTSMGKAIPGEEILIVDKNNRPVEPGQTGELVHRGLLVAQGYWGDPGLTAARFKPNPFRDTKVPIPETVVYSGDLVKIDHDGFLYFVGRNDNMIKCAGNRISPTEIEDIIYCLPGIEKVVAMGIPDGIYGQTILVVISIRPDYQIDAHAVKRHCVKHMPVYMIPKNIEIWKSIPLNANGKIDNAAIKNKIYSKMGIQKNKPI